MQPAFSELGFSTRLIESPTGKSPFLLAEYRENPLSYRSHVWARRRRRWHGGRVAQQPPSVANNDGRRSGLRPRHRTIKANTASICRPCARCMRPAAAGSASTQNSSSKWAKRSGRPIWVRSARHCARSWPPICFWLPTDRVRGRSPDHLSRLPGDCEFISTSTCVKVRTIPATGAGFSPMRRFWARRWRRWSTARDGCCSTN